VNERVFTYFLMEVCMKLGVMTNCFIRDSWDGAVKKARNAGVTALEPAAGGFLGNVHCNPEVLLANEDALKRFIEIYESQGMEISALAVHGNPLHPDAAIAEDHRNVIVKGIKLARKLRVTVLNGFAGCPGAGEGALYPNWITCPWPPFFGEAVKWQWEKKILPFWREMAKRLRDSGVRLAFEMHPGDAVYNPETFLMLRDEVGEGIACNFDPSHILWQGIDPLVALKRIGTFVVHVHAKDVVIEEDTLRWRGNIDWKPQSDILNRVWTFRTLGYGHDRLWWKKFVSTLKVLGYDGVLSIEYEDPLMSADEGLRKAVSFMNDVLFFEEAGEAHWM
jgi:sugar phosphate isomerase/epimerase